MLSKEQLKQKLLKTNYFVNNEYLDKYLDLVLTERQINSAYYEKHHVIPVSLYKLINKCKTKLEALAIADGDPDNYIKILLYKDHVYSHYLLYFCTKGKLKHGMGESVFRMISIYPKLVNKTKKYIPTQKEFNELQKLFEKIVEDPNSRFWKQEQINYLIEHYAETPIQEIADYLGKSYSSTKSKALSLKLKRNVNHWTASEIKFLKDNYSQFGMAYCAESLNRSMTAVKSKTSELGIRRLNCNNSGRFWTKEEDSFLRENYKLLGIAECSKKLNRTNTSIVSRAGRLDLLENTRYTEEEKEFLRENYKKFGANYCAEKLGKSVDAIRGYMTHQLKVKRLPQGTVIYCPELNKYFTSIAQASVELNMSDGNICAIVNGKIKSSKGLTFYKVDKEEYYKNNEINYQENTNIIKKVVQLTKDYQYIKTFNSISEAALAFKDKKYTAGISLVCRHRRNFAWGYRWMYLEEWEKLQNEKRSCKN